MFSVGAGNIVHSVQGTVPLFLRGKGKMVVGATSANKLGNTRTNTTCKTSGRTIVKLAGGATCVCTGDNVHYGTVTPNNIRAGVTTSVGGLGRFKFNHAGTIRNIVPEIKGPRRVTRITLFLTSSSSDFIGNSIVITSNK